MAQAPIGKFYQVSWVVKDIDSSEKYFVENMGVPRFFHLKGISAEMVQGTYRGRPGDFKADFYLGFSGDMQIELVQHLGGSSIYKEFLEKAGPGIHHVAYLVPDFEKGVEALTSRGYPVIQSFVPPGGKVAYCDTEAATGIVTEVMYLDDDGKKLFEQIRKNEF